MLRKVDEGDDAYLQSRFTILLGPAAASSDAASAETGSNDSASTDNASGDPVAGEAIFVANGCDACHGDKDTVVAPTLHGIFGKEIELADGSTVTIDEAYLHESIIDPQAKLVKDYGPLMPPSYQTLDEQALLDMIAYIRSLTP
jgi:cytochrome c oxidase subunit 2